MLTPDQEKLKEAAQELISYPSIANARAYADVTGPAAILAILAQLEQVQGDAARWRFARLNSYIEARCGSPRVDGWTAEFIDHSVDLAMAVQPLPPPPEAA